MYVLNENDYMSYKILINCNLNNRNVTVITNNLLETKKLNK